jgi:ParB family transcriptional regulator, chromosome partitioning protein
MQSNQVIKPSKVIKVPIENIEQNPHNPRRIFESEPLEVLKESIKKVGVLVPITVYPKFKKEDVTAQDKFILLDGERRWRACKDLGIEEIPANIVDTPSEQQNILTMFHIHYLREQWMLMPTALKLQTLMTMLKTENERELAEATKLPVTTVRRCKILLSYPEKYQNMLLAMSHKRLKADFFIELQRIRTPAMEVPFPFWGKEGDEKCVDAILNKFLNGVIKSVLDSRKIVEIYRGALSKNLLDKFYEQFKLFIEMPSMTIDEINVPGANFAKELRQIGITTKRLVNQLAPIDPDVISSDTKIVDELKELQRLIRNKLEKALLD